ncbi:polyprenyl diphosphate synthase [Paracoccaceae bacterium GXU_MW_L88]
MAQPAPSLPMSGPKHVAIIMDGNGRWATKRGLARLAGHRRGVDRVRDIVRACPELGVDYLTLFAFSTENWKRTEEEVAGLMRLFNHFLQKEAEKLHQSGVCVRFLGDRSALAAHLQTLMGALEEKTAGNTRLHLNVALNYGGRDEIMRAMARMAEAGVTEFTEDAVAAHLDTGGLPDPDLVIRTSGEQRISNFLLWQAAYAEYAFVDLAWPDYTVAAFRDTLNQFGTRERRFGAVL